MSHRSFTQDFKKGKLYRTVNKNSSKNTLNLSEKGIWYILGVISYLKNTHKTKPRHGWRGYWVVSLLGSEGCN